MNELLICFLLAIPFGGGTCIFMLGVSGWLDDIFKKIERKLSHGKRKRFTKPNRRIL